ncbi:MAG: ABC transporter substrate-binding protein [Chloroflexi bacterium]|nr:ABC transporter substrate-binding protein [Chloroflexota bacterium]|tara:strand:- start:38530 stop:40215 length:1686 start_codon:yes stop_codon:yes gene_type:complete
MKKILLTSLCLVILMVLGCSNDAQVSLDVSTDDRKEQSTKSVSSSAQNTEKSQAQSTQKTGGGTFRRLWSDPPTLDPHLTKDTTSAGIVVEIFSGLVGLSTDLELVADLAETWDIDSTGTIYTFKIRENAKFHNGKNVTADDVKWSFERSASKETASPVAETYLGDIVGLKDYMEGKADSIKGLKVIDQQTIQITIDAPKPYFLAKLSYPTSYVLDRDVVTAGGRNWWLENPVGTGPFKLTEYKIGERIVLTRNDDYHLGPIDIHKIEMYLGGGQSMAMYENDEIDITGVGLFDLERVLDKQEPLNKDLVIAPPGFSISYIGFNTTMPPFDDKKFRQALNHAIDKKMIAKDVLSDLVVPAYRILPIGFPGRSENIDGLSYDQDLAKQLLKESKYSDSSSRPRITITVPGTGGTLGLDLEVILEMWKQTLDIEVEIQQVEWATFLEELDKEALQVYAGLGWEADYPDPQDFLDILFHSQSAQNHGQHSNSQLDDILERARVEQDINSRIELYRQAEQIIVNEAYWVPLWFTGEQYALIKPRVQGYVLTPMTVPKLSKLKISE